MTGTVEWYLAREGKQYGPLSEAEMQKLVELGHMRPDDLVWRAGFPDWQSAGQVFAPPPKAAPPPPPPVAPVEPAAPQLYEGGAVQTMERAAGERASAQTMERAAGERASAQTAQRHQPHQPYEPPYQPQLRDPRQLDPRPQPERRPATGATASPTARPGAAARAAEPARAPARDQGPIAADRSGAPQRAAKRSRRGLRRAAMLLLLLCVLGGAAFAAYTYRGTLQTLAMNAATAPSPAASAPPLKGFSDNVESLDGKLQKAPLWQLLRREFPEWYQERLNETSRLVAEGRPEQAVAKSLAEGLVALRRKNADHALAAPLPKLKRIAETFHANLTRLGEFNKIACFAFISQNEAHPIVVDLMQKPEHSAAVQSQLTAVFEAIGEGRRSPQKHLPPRKADYDEVTRILTQKGWKEADLELFSDSAELAKAPPAAVCRLVTDWFDAHLAIKNDEALVRLLVEAVRPVVGG